jgi:hypothetical protein
MQNNKSEKLGPLRSPRELVLCSLRIWISESSAKVCNSQLSRILQSSLKPHKFLNISICNFFPVTSYFYSHLILLNPYFIFQPNLIPGEHEGIYFIPDNGKLIAIAPTADAKERHHIKTISNFHNSFVCLFYFCSSY